MENWIDSAPRELEYDLFGFVFNFTVQEIQALANGNRECNFFFEDTNLVKYGAYSREEEFCEGGHYFIKDTESLKSATFTLNG